jgi:hypothetical protein
MQRPHQQNQVNKLTKENHLNRPANSVKKQKGLNQMRMKRGAWYLAQMAVKIRIYFRDLNKLPFLLIFLDFPLVFY